MIRLKSNWVLLLLLCALGSILVSIIVYERYPQKLVRRLSQNHPYDPIPFEQNPSYSPRLEAFAADTSKAHIVMLGDSHFSEIQWSRLLPVKNIHNQGIAGDITTGMLARLHQVQDKQPDIVVLLAGINDILTGRQDSVIINTSKIIRKLNTSNIQVILISILPVSRGFPHANTVNQYVESINHHISNICQQTLCTYIDAAKALAPQGHLPDSLTYDGVHLNSTGIHNLTNMLGPLMLETPHDL